MNCARASPPPLPNGRFPGPLLPRRQMMSLDNNFPPPPPIVDRGRVAINVSPPTASPPVAFQQSARPTRPSQRPVAPLVIDLHRPTTANKRDHRSSQTKSTSSKKTTTMTTAPAKLYGKNLSEYDELDVDQLLSQLSPEEISILAKEVDPDDNLLPPSERCSYECNKEATGPLNRKKLIEHINKQALETPDLPEMKPYVAGTVRGKKWVAPETNGNTEHEDKIAIDLDDEYGDALNTASQEEIIDLAAILGFHSMMNQDQYHASLLNKGQPVGLGWDGVTKATQPKVYPPEPPNQTDPEDSIKRVLDDDSKLLDLNWNNIKNISDEKFENLFKALVENTHLETLSLVNVGLTDRLADKLAEALEKNCTLRVCNVETNFISPVGIVHLVKSLLKQRSLEEFRATNQRSQVLGNKIEMELTKLIEQNPTILRLGLHLEYNDARHRIASHLQRNIDRSRLRRTGHFARTYTGGWVVHKKAK